MSWHVWRLPLCLPKAVDPIHWLEGAFREESANYSINYTLVLEFGHLQDGKLSGKIYMALPDQLKSTLSGSFVLEGAR